MSELQQIIWDVILFSETRTVTSTLTLEDGSRLFTSKGEHKADGVAIFVHKHIIPYVIRVRRFGGRLIFIDLRMQYYTVRLVSIYCPHAGYSFDDLKFVCNNLTGILEEARQANFRIIVGGDFNTVTHW